eukprot:PITA_13520
METMREVLSIAAQNKWKAYQMDVKLAFLNGVLMEEVYIEQPPGYEKKGQEHKESKAAITPIVMGLKLIKEDNGKDFDPRLYKSIVGGLMYLIATRMDIMHVVSLISRFMERPKEAHWQAAKRILRYVKGTKRFGILYTTSKCSYLIRYNDSDCVGSVDDQKSKSGYVFHMGSGAISWASKKQPIVALSTTKAGYVAATAATCQAIWMKRMLRSLCQLQTKGTVILCDNRSAIALHEFCVS